MTKRKRAKRVRIILMICSALFVFAALYSLFVENDQIGVTKLEYANPNIPKEFDGFRVVHVSDLHNRYFKGDHSYLLSKIREAEPDIIVYTGDLNDSKLQDFGRSMSFIDGCVKIAPTYFVSGNHEYWVGEWTSWRRDLVEAGAILTEDVVNKLEKDGAYIDILGVYDPVYFDSDEEFISSIDNVCKKSNSKFKILLSHRPEFIDAYAQNGLDLVFAGHAHGGQIRIPFICGLIAPNQGLFPRYSSGIHKKQNTSVVVNRGLGNTIIPIRLFNKPEIIALTLKSR